LKIWPPKTLFENSALSFSQRFQRELRNKTKKGVKEEEKKAENVVVKQDKFRSWWIEGKLDNYEIIKYYLIEWIVH
jgi:hypothetical protein